MVPAVIMTLLLSFTEFPPIQKHILKNKLINLALTIAYNDYELYVQVSAFKCVTAAVKISSVWEQLKEEYTNLLVSIICTILIIQTYHSRLIIEGVAVVS
jgi:hypothetical protein